MEHTLPSRISHLCPICDEPLESVITYYGGTRCPRGHYSEDHGNYHTDICVGSKVFHSDEGYYDYTEEQLQTAIKDLREQVRLLDGIKAMRNI